MANMTDFNRDETISVDQLQTYIENCVLPTDPSSPPRVLFVQELGTSRYQRVVSIGQNKDGDLIICVPSSKSA